MLKAVGDVLADEGLAGVDLADVARRAGVGKTTVYRRWGSVARDSFSLAGGASRWLPRV